MVSHHPAKFGGHKHCGNRDKMILAVEEQDSTCSHQSLMSLQHMAWKHNTYHVSKFHIDYMCLKQQWKEKKQITFFSQFNNTDEKERKK